MISPETAHWIIVLWLTAIGASIGSFMNVVVYRLPLGLSLSKPPSHCPRCKERIRWYDNVPVFGWIKLRGRCRNCHCPISIRYPAIEALVAAMFGVLASFELSAGESLSLRVLPVIAETPFYVQYPYHLALLCTLLCAALIEYDGERPPLRLYGFALLIGLGLPLVWPALRPWGIRWPWAVRSELSPWLVGVADGVAGVAAGVLLAGLWSVVAHWCGRLSTCQENQADSPKGEHGKSAPGPTVGAALVCVGAFLGWQAVASLAVLTAVLTVATLPPRRMWPKLHVPATAVLMALTLGLILLRVSLASP
ncbi:MAG: prepilin peptidase [Thermoguttaceae bacterium]